MLLTDIGNGVRSVGSRRSYFNDRERARISGAAMNYGGGKGR